MDNPTDEMVRMVAERFRALADETRIRIMMCLRRGECNVTTLCREVGIAQASMSKHLALLRQAGLAGVRREGAQAFYFVHDPTVFDLCGIVCDGVERRQRAISKALGLDPAPRRGGASRRVSNQTKSRETTR